MVLESIERKITVGLFNICASECCVLLYRARTVDNDLVNVVFNLNEFSGVKAEFSWLEIVGFSAVAMVCAAKRSICGAEEAVMANTNHFAASLEDRVALVFLERTDGVIRYGVSHSVILTASVVAGIGEIIQSLVLEYERTLCNEAVNRFPRLFCIDDAIGIFLLYAGEIVLHFCNENSVAVAKANVVEINGSVVVNEKASVDRSVGT